MEQNTIREVVFMSLIDLHIHTRESDGTDTPEQVIRKAIELK